jgi:energy-coupling factor transport system substrate-specific component
VTIAVLSALGGTLSAYVGYLANLFNSFVGTPFGAGQVLAGLHVFWLLLARGTTGRTGSGTATGFLKGTVEMLAGSIHGVFIVLVSLVEGLIVDVLLLRFSTSDRFGYMVAGGFATASNVLIFQLFFLSGVPLSFVLVITMIAFGSGVVFAGYFSHSVLESLSSSGLIPGVEEQSSSRWVVTLGYIIVASFIVGSVWFYGTVYSWRDTGGIDVEGLVNEPYTYQEKNFQGDVVTVEAELKGTYVHVEPRNYTGVPLSSIVEAAKPSEGVTGVVLTATDGYSVELDIDMVLGDASIIVVTERGQPRLVAGSLDGSLWVQSIVEVKLV